MPEYVGCKLGENESNFINIPIIQSILEYWSFQTKLIHEPFNLVMEFEGFSGTSFSGKYMVIIYLEAYDQNDEKRPNIICVSIKGDVEQI